MRLVNRLWTRAVAVALLVVRVAPWALFFLVCVLGTKRCLEVIDAPEAGAIANDCCETWVKCPDRKPVREGRHRFTWYCAPDHPDVLAARQRQTTKTSPPARPARPTPPKARRAESGKGATSPVTSSTVETTPAL